MVSGAVGGWAASVESVNTLVAEPLGSALANPDWALDLPDDRESIGPHDRVLLVVDDDRAFAQILLDMARARGFKVVLAGRVESAFTLLARFKVDAVTLDLRLPDRDGWVVLDRLKHDPRTRHVPVHIISVEDDEKRGLKQGAMAYLHKPVSKDGVEAALGRIKAFVHGLFHRSLCRFGVLGLGRKESLRFTPHESEYEEVDPDERLYRKVS